MKSKYLVLAFALQSAILDLHAQGSFVTGGVSPTIDTGSLTSIFEVIQDPVSRDYTAFFLFNQGSDTFQFSTALDEGVRTFLVNLNDTISLQPIQSGAYSELLYPNTYTFPDRVPFYVGLYTGRNPNGSLTPPADGIYKDPLFGWARLDNVDGTIQLLDSALVYNAAGINAGTTTILQVPEPGSLGLAALGLLALGWWTCSDRLRSTDGSA
jgi:hypothetical protein